MFCLIYFYRLFWFGNNTLLYELYQLEKPQENQCKKTEMIEPIIKTIRMLISCQLFIFSILWFFSYFCSIDPRLYVYPASCFLHRSIGILCDALKILGNFVFFFLCAQSYISINSRRCKKKSAEKKETFSSALLTEMVGEKATRKII
jgi:hypothetical protein